MGAGAEAPEAFNFLFNALVVRDDGAFKKSKKLIILEQEGIDLAIISSILSGTGINFLQAFNLLFNVLVAQQDDGTFEKSEQLKILERSGVSLTDIFNLLGGTGTKALIVLDELFLQLLTKRGNVIEKSELLETLEKNNISLTTIANIISGAKVKTAKTLLSLFKQLFTKQNNGIFVKSELLTTLENNEIYLPDISIIIARSGANAPESLNSLFNKLFILNPNYNPTIPIDRNYTFYTEYVSANKKYIEFPICTTFKKYMGIPKMCSLLSGSGVNIKNTMETLFNLLFIENNNNYVPIPNININSLDRKEKHDAIVNSEELGSRSDAYM